MQKIGEGYYYNVYEIQTNRVIKKRKNIFRSFYYIVVKSNKFKINGFKEFISLHTNKNKIKDIYNKIIQNIKDISEIGNPYFINEFEYTQDKVTILKDILIKSDIETQKEIIEKYINSIKKSWKQGYSDIVFNFTINNGLDKNNTVILIDFNEIVFEKSEIAKRIQKQKWLIRYSYTQLSGELKEYYKKRMSEEITIDQLENLWKDVYSTLD